MNNNDNNKKYHCIKCGKIWGEGEDTHSYGICLECFAEYINNKKASKGLVPCFGKLNQGTVCDSCKWKRFCEKYYKEHHEDK